MLDNKRAQVGETMTWVIATIVIVVILIFSIFIVSFKLKDESKEFKTQNKDSDLIAAKSLLGYLSTKDSNGMTVYEQLKDKNDSKDVKGIFDEFNGNLAKNIFLKLYKNDYREDRIWLGVYYDVVGIGPKRNIYFESSHVDIKGGDQNWKKTMMPYALEEIKLDEERWLVLVLTN